MAATDFHYLGLVEIGQKLQAKELSSVEITKALLGRIDELDGKLRSFAYVMADSALAQAAAAEKEIVGSLSRSVDGQSIILARRSTASTWEAPLLPYRLTPSAAPSTSIPHQLKFCALPVPAVEGIV